MGIYDDHIKKVKELRAQHFPAGDRAGHIREVLSTIAGFMRALEREGLAWEFREFPIPHGHACSCLLASGEEITATCGSTLGPHGEMEVRVGPGKWDSLRDGVTPHRFTKPHSPEEGLAMFQVMLEYIVQRAAQSA